MVIAGSILWFNGWVNNLDCRRVEASQIDCTIQTEWLGLFPWQQQSVSRLQAANFEPTCSRNKNNSRSLESCTYSVSLTTASGIIDLSPSLASGGNEAYKQQVVQEINAFINTPSMPSLHTTQSELGPQTVVLGLMVLLGLTLIERNIKAIIRTR